tara:strand:- start:143 stop:526 length:384 start_codon:yes stop_codon:yes gene_type:complete
MAIPSGSGTEVLKRTTIHALSNVETAFRWDGTMATTGTSTYTVTANHIITVLNIVVAETQSSEENFNIYMHDGSNAIHLLRNQSLSFKETFVWNDRLVLTGGDKLILYAEASANIDVVCNYIDQDWS